MVEKRFITPNELLLGSYQLARKIIDSGFKPNFLIGLWRGGSPVGIAVQEFLDYHDVKTDHISIRTSAYKSIDEMQTEIKVHGLDYIIKRVKAEDKLLIVDDVHDSGLTIKAVLAKLSEKARKNTPQEIKIATIFYKPCRNQTGFVPDFFVHQTEQWLIFPHELEGLSKDEIKLWKGEEIARLLK